MKFGLNYSTYKITVAPGKPVKQDVVCTYVRCLESNGSVMMSVNGARPRIFRTGQWIESPAVSYVTSAGNVPDDLVIRTLEFAAIEGETAPVTLLIATSTGRDGDDSFSITNEVPVVARDPLPVVARDALPVVAHDALPVLMQQTICPNPPGNAFRFAESWEGYLPYLSESIQGDRTGLIKGARLWLAAIWRNDRWGHGDVVMPAGSEVVLLTGFEVEQRVAVPTDGVLRLFPYLVPPHAEGENPDLDIFFDLCLRGSQMKSSIDVRLTVWGFVEPL